ncbi:MAG: 16S rRNA (uracil(1498)-N(3))-methyltransferase [Mastigocoleus sp.]
MTQLQRIAIQPSQMQQDKVINLDEEQLHYLCRVLRLRPGSNFIAMDGMGKWWLAQLRENNAIVIEEVENYQRELSTAITLIVALPKNGFDEIVRCTTELGAACIIPVISDRTLLKPSPQKLQRWQRIAQEAAEQSERSIIPSVLEPAALKSVLSSTLVEDDGNSSFINTSIHRSTYRYICAAREDSNHLINCLQKLKLQNPDSSNQLQHLPLQYLPQIVIATGPEGGWTEAEINYAVDLGFVKVSLGKRILRAVTAPIAALSMITSILESDSIQF